MAKVTACTLIIKDDFNNILILKNKVKRGEPELWSLLTHKMRGKDTEDKCITRAAKEALKSIIFDEEKINEYVIDEEQDEAVAVYTCRIRERVVLHKNYKDSTWIGRSSIDSYNFSEIDKKILHDFFAAK